MLLLYKGTAANTLSSNTKSRLWIPSFHSAFFAFSFHSFPFLHPLPCCFRFHIPLSLTYTKNARTYIHKLILKYISNQLYMNMLNVSQGFNWESSNKGGWYNSLKNSIPDLANAGITHVWLPPPSQSVAPQGTLFYMNNQDAFG